MKYKTLQVAPSVIKQYLELVEGLRIKWVFGDELSPNTRAQLVGRICDKVGQSLNVPTSLFDSCVQLDTPRFGHRPETYFYHPLDQVCYVIRRIGRSDVIVDLLVPDERTHRTLRLALGLSVMSGRAGVNVFPRTLEICLVHLVQNTPLGLGDLRVLDLWRWIDRTRPSKDEPGRLIADSRFKNVALQLRGDFKSALSVSLLPRGLTNATPDKPEEAGLWHAACGLLVRRSAIRHTFVLCSHHSFRAVMRSVSPSYQLNGRAPRFPLTGTVFSLDWGAPDPWVGAVRFSLVDDPARDEEE